MTTLLSSSIAGPSRRLAVALPVTAHKHQRRKIHKRQELHFDISEGCPPFLSPKALQTIAVEYQDGLLERLNDQVRGTPWETSSVVQTVIGTAPDRTHALAFNLASQALNNSYFLSRLTRDRSRTNPSTSAESLSLKIRKNFGSITQFQHAFSSSALGMAGSGWLWLVMDAQGTLGIVGTYGAGTVLVQGRQQRGEFSELVQEHSAPSSSAEDIAANTSSSNSSSDNATSPTDPAAPPLLSGDHRPSTQPTKDSLSSILTPSGSKRPSETFTDDVFQSVLGQSSSPETSSISPQFRKLATQAFHPLFCLSIHEHAWLTDYGVWGKEEYLKRFWGALDWQKVGIVYDKLAPKDLNFGLGNLGLT